MGGFLFFHLLGNRGRLEIYFKNYMEIPQTGSIALHINFALHQSEAGFQEAAKFGTYLKNINYFTAPNSTDFLEQYVGYRGALEFLGVHLEIQDYLDRFCWYVAGRQAATFRTQFLQEFLISYRAQHDVVEQI